MKQSAFAPFVLALFFISSCATQKQNFGNDDVYANPKEDRIEEARIAAEKKAAREAREKRYNDSIAAIQKAKDDANPYYKDREFKYDDYYDYEYATRLKRFNNNIDGLGYYDNYYTNSYWYSGNPYNYGTSVYSGYSWWGPSYNYYSYNPSVSFYMNYGWGSYNGWGGYNGYNPYDPYGSAYWQGYNNGYYHGYNNGWGGYPYSGFGYGFGYGYGYNPYGYSWYPYGGYGGYGYYYPYNPYNGWGYYNGYDSNSSYTYGPRASHTGNNSPRTSNPGVNSPDGYYKQYVTSVSQQQAVNPKFTDLEPARANAVKYGTSVNTGTPGRVQNNGGYSGGSGNNGNNGSFNNYPVRNENGNGAVKTPVRDYNTSGNETTTPVKVTQPIRTYDNQPVKQQYDAQPTKQQNPVREYEPQQQQQPAKQYYEQPVKQYQAPARDFNSQPSFPSNNGGGGGGVRNGGGRPR